MQASVIPPALLGGLCKLSHENNLSESRRLPLLQKSLFIQSTTEKLNGPVSGLRLAKCFDRSEFHSLQEKNISSGFQPAALGAKRRSMQGSKACEAAHPSWWGGEVDALFQAYEAW